MWTLKVMYVNQYSWITQILWKLVAKKQTWFAKLPVDNHTIRFGKKTRTYLLTASNFGIVCKRKDTTPPDNLIKLLRAYRKDLLVHKIPSIHHGQKYEAKARRCYAKEHLKTSSSSVYRVYSSLSVILQRDSQDKSPAGQYLQLKQARI